MILNHSVRRSLWVAAGYLVAAVVLNELRRRQLLGTEMVERLMGTLMGAVAIVFANEIPKRLVPLARLSCDPAREQTLRRFAGRVLVLGGLGYMLAFALAPIAIAATLAISLLAPAVAVVGVVRLRCLWMRRGARVGDA